MTMACGSQGSTAGGGAAAVDAGAATESDAYAQKETTKDGTLTDDGAHVGADSSELEGAGVSPDFGVLPDANALSEASVSPDVGAEATPSNFAVVTNRYDNSRSGANLNEKTLTAASVGSGAFRLLFSQVVNGQIYAQPLYLSNLQMPDGRARDVVFVATEQNIVYAFDANGTASSAPLWQRSLGPAGSTTAGAIRCDNLGPSVGITATPVIDPATGTMYVVSKTFDGALWAQNLHALDVTTGNDRAGSPVAIRASVPGTASDAVAGVVSFNPMYQLGRTGLLLANGVVYLAFASHCDLRPYHGWVMGYRYAASGFTQTSVFNVSPNGFEGGIWQAGVGLSSDGSSLYAVIGNGSTNTNATPPDLSESVVRLSLTDLSVQDYWTPTGYAYLNQVDADLSTGAILLPHNLLITGSKGGFIYVLDRTNLGKYSATGDRALQRLSTPGGLAGLPGHLHGGPIYYSSPGSGAERVYLWPEDSQLSGYDLDPSTHFLKTSAGGAPTVQGHFAAVLPGHPGGIMTLSANAGVAGTAILWASTPKDPLNGAWHTLDTGVLYAIDAEDITHVLWKSDPLVLQDGSPAKVAKFNAPVVANGRVFVATFSNALNVYGLH